MGIWSTLTSHAKSQFLDVIEWLDDSDNTVVYRFPVFNQAITDNSKLVVRESQAAVFVAEGQLSDVFAPGTYTLTTQNAAISSFFSSIAYGLNYPYKGDVYFVNTKQFRENRWGTQNPFMMRDPEFGPVRVRAFGIYSFRVTDPALFLRQVVGTDGLFTTGEITGQLKSKLVSGLSGAIGQAKLPVLDLVAHYTTLGDHLREAISPIFEQAYGITLVDFTIENISLPPEVEKALDARTKMGVLGNLDAYTKLQAADALPIAAANQGLAGAGVGMGVGLGVGQLMGQALGQGASAGPPPLPTDSPFHYNGPTGQGQFTSQQIAERVAANRTAQHLVWQAGFDRWKPWSEVPAIAAKVPPASPPPPPTANPLFHYHGPAGQGEYPASQIAEWVQADPSASHQVWQAGFADWKPATEVPEIMGGAPSPPSPSGPPPLPPS